MSVYQIVMLLFAGAAATGGQLSITKAYTKAPAKEISVSVSYTHLDVYKRQAAISATLLMYECNRQRRLLGE